MIFTPKNSLFIISTCDAIASNSCVTRPKIIMSKLIEFFTKCDLATSVMASDTEFTFLLDTIRIRNRKIKQNFAIFHFFNFTSTLLWIEWNWLKNVTKKVLLSMDIYSRQNKLCSNLTQIGFNRARTNKSTQEYNIKCLAVHILDYSRWIFTAFKRTKEVQENPSMNLGFLNCCFFVSIFG